MQTFTNCYSRTDSKKTSKTSDYKALIKIAFVLTFILFAHFSSAHHFGTVSGFIRTETGEPLAGIHVRLDGTSYATTTDNEGKFEIKNVPVGTYTFLASGIGYQVKKENIEVKTNQETVLQYKLNSHTNELSEVVISSVRNQSFSAVNKINVPLRDLPLTTSTVTVKTIEQRGADDLGEAMKNTTGVRANNTYGGFQHFTIRGFSNFVLLVDGVRDERHNISTSAPNTNLANVESIKFSKARLRYCSDIPLWEGSSILSVSTHLPISKLIFLQLMAVLIQGGFVQEQEG